MDRTQNSHLGKRLSLFQLFSNTDITIEVPTIQRDYAQGRKNKSEVRNLFLQALYNYLDENQPDRDLDFVYGSTEILDGTTKFIPLDGQQRLTTLFLLHWYLAQLSGNSMNFRDFMLVGNRARFTYNTRPSSSEFINALLVNDIDLNNLIISKDSKSESLSETIMDKGWYFLSWAYDPTIQSMLTMLDAIHEKFKNHEFFYERLTSLHTPIITFQYLNLKEFNLTEDLYIKMNSRGKPLTSFENFKAKFEQHISELFGENVKPFSISNRNIKASYREYFSFRIDTGWADLFWRYKHLAGKPHTFDEELMNFIRTIIANQFAIEFPQTLTSFRELIKSDSATAELTENVSYYKFTSLGALTKDCIDNLIRSLDSLSNDDQKIKTHLADSFYYDENQYFEKSLRYSLSLPERAMFHAYLKYLNTHSTENANFYQWMRVIHNLIENSRIEDAEQLVNAISSIEKLALHSGDILTYLTSSNCRIEFFTSWQVEEEIIKSHLILRSSEWKELIEDFEKQSFHKGQLGYLFEYSGVLRFFSNKKKCNWSSEENDNFMDVFKSYALRSVALFSIIDTPENDDFIVERALLSKGDYLIPASNNRFNFCSSKKAANYQRDYSWKRLLRFTSEDIEAWEARREVVKQLLDDPSFDYLKVRKSLLKIFRNATPTWRGYFVSNSQLIECCDQGFIRVVEGEEVELLYASQLNHYHCDMYIFNLFSSKLGDVNQYAPFTVQRVDVKNSDDLSFLLFDGWIFEKKAYQMKVYRDERKFYLSVSKQKGNRDQDQFNPKITDLLKNRGFAWSDDELEFFISAKNDSKLVLNLKELCADLNRL